MNLSKSIQFALTPILVVIFCNTVMGQKIEPKERKLEPDHKIISKILDKEFELFISFPNSYTTKDSVNYPVLYVLDGGFTFRTFHDAQKYLSIDGTIEEVIIVGINSNTSGPTGRSYDYTVSSDTIADRKMDEFYGMPKGSFKTGGASKFLESIKSEIAPFIDTNYKTNNDRGISGHSLGGLFTAYCLINSDGYFTRFGIHSPALYWNNDAFLNQSISEIENKVEWQIPHTKVLITVGDAEGSSMVPAAIKLSTFLQELNSENLDIKWKLFENEKHFSVISSNLSRTLSVLYAKE